MNTALSEAIKEAFAHSPSTDVYLETIEISHAESNQVFYLVKDLQDHVFTLEDGTTTKTFEACGFRMTLPASGENGIQELNIAIDNVDLRIGDFLESVKDSNSPVKILFRPYLHSHPEAPQMNPPLELSLRNVTMNEIEISGSATFADIVNKKFPTEIYTRQNFPSLGN
jgi:hypothetical protein